METPLKVPASNEKQKGYWQSSRVFLYSGPTRSPPGPKRAPSGKNVKAAEKAKSPRKLQRLSSKGTDEEEAARLAFCDGLVAEYFGGDE